MWQCALRTTFGHARKMRAHSAENIAIFLGRRVAHCVGQIDDLSRPPLPRPKGNLAEEIHVGAACVFGGKLHFLAVLRAKPHHLRDLVERFRARNPQLVLQMQVRSGQKNMQPGFGGGFQSTKRRIYIFLPRARQSGDAAIFDFACDGPNRFKVPRRGDREARLDDIHAKLFELTRQQQLLFPIH